MPSAQDNLLNILKRISISNNNLSPISFLNFIELAITFLEETIRLRENNAINLIHPTHIKMDYKNDNNQHYYSILEIKRNTSPALAPNANEYIKNTAFILQKLFSKTEIAQKGLESIISHFITTELALFSSRQTNYRNVNINKEIAYLKNIFLAIKKLLEYKPLTDLNMSAIEQSISIEELALFIRENAARGDFNEKLTVFFIEKTNETSNVSDHATPIKEGSATNEKENALTKKTTANQSEPCNEFSFFPTFFTRLFHCAQRKNSSKVYVALSTN